MTEYLIRKNVRKKLIEEVKIPRGEKVIKTRYGYIPRDAELIKTPKGMMARRGKKVHAPFKDFEIVKSDKERREFLRKFEAELKKSRRGY